MKAKKKRALAKASYVKGKRILNRERFLGELDSIVPWKQWLFLVQPHSPYKKDDGRKLDMLLRMYLLQGVFGIPDKAAGAVMGDSLSMLRFLGCKSVDEATVCAEDLPRFKANLEAVGVGKPLLDALSRYMSDDDLRTQAGAASDAAIEALPAASSAPQTYAAPSSVLTPAAVSVSQAGASPVQPPVAAATAAAFVGNPAALDGSQRGEQAGASLDGQTEGSAYQAQRRVPIALPQEDFDPSGWGRGEMKDPPKRRRRIWPYFVIAALAVLAYLYGPALYARVRPWITERFPKAAFLAAEPTATSTLLPIRVAEVTGIPTVIPTPRRSAYSAESEVTRNKALLSGNAAPAAVVSKESTLRKKAALTLDGLLDKDTMLGILKIVGVHDTNVSFFPSGVQAAEAPDIVEEIGKAGYPVGNYTLRGEPHMEVLTAEQLVEDFTSAQKILQEVTGKAPTQIKGNALEYTDNVLRAAGAVGIPEAVQSTAYLTFQSFKSYEETLAWVNRLAVGSIISIKLSSALDPSEYQPKEVVEKPAIDMESTLEVQPQVQPDLGTASERVLQLVEWLLRAIDESNFAPETVAMREGNRGVLAEAVTSISTTQPAVGYAFYGDYTRDAEIDGVLKSLSQLGGKGTFFVTAKNLSDSPANIRKIVSAGHRVEVAYSAARNDEFYSISSTLLKTSTQLLEQFGSKPRMAMQSSGGVTDPFREAVSSLGLMMVQQDLSFTREDAKGALTPAEAISAVYKSNPEGFHRGKIVGFRLGYYDVETLLSDLLTALQGTRNAYAITDIYELATNKAFVYTYPLAQSAILPEVLNRIHPGQLPVAEKDLIDVVKSHYIGNPGISTSKQLPGFSNGERLLIDKAGKIKGATNIAFLTFDDWGSDVGITKLLAVLKKYHVKATFFVRTEFVPQNPNLLRAIALDGHEIASHTNTHYPLSNDLNGTWEFTELSDEQIIALQADIIKSWEVLQSIVGDIRLENGNPALSLNFRPPTMAVGRKGFETVFDLGFKYVVNGEYTSHDYQAQSVDDLFKAMQRGIRSGAVVVMHSSDNSAYTAEALEMYFQLNASGKKKTYQFARLSDYLEAPQASAAPSSKPSASRVPSITPPSSTPTTSPASTTAP
ncbi:MAG: polysaccharide deacetylase family protein [Christensenellales bacterium]